MVAEALAALAMVVGTFFMVVTGVGLVRFPDVYTRMHAAGKAGTVGIALLILAPTVYFAASDPFENRSAATRCTSSEVTRCTPASVSSSPKWRSK